MVRSLAAAVEHCLMKFCLRLLQSIQEGLSLWLANKSDAWSERDMMYDLRFSFSFFFRLDFRAHGCLVDPLYPHILVKIQLLSESLATLEGLAPILDSVFRKRVPSLADEAFVD